MDILESLRKELNEKRRELQEKKALQRKYRNTASEIKELYNRLLLDKEDVEAYNKSYKSFAKENYDDFRGAVHDGEYRPAIEGVTAAYKAFIKNIDANLDDLNVAATKYENKANNLNGPIGYLQSAINSLATTVENWLN